MEKGGLHLVKFGGLYICVCGGRCKEGSLQRRCWDSSRGFMHRVCFGVCAQRVCGGVLGCVCARGSAGGGSRIVICVERALGVHVLRLNMVHAGFVWKGGVLRCSDGGCVCKGVYSAGTGWGGVGCCGRSVGECGKASPAWQV